MAGLFGGALPGQSLPPGNDPFGALSGFGLPGPGMPPQQQQSNTAGLPFDLGLGFQQSLNPNGMFNLNGARNTNDPGGAPGAFNGGFSGDIGARGNNQQGAGALPALLAQYLSQTTDQTSRAGALSLFQSLANGNTSGPLPTSMQGLEALLSQGSPHQQHQARAGMSGMDGGRGSNNNSSSLPVNGAPLTNAAALAALTSLGITPTMLDALGLGSVAQQMLDAPVESNSKKERSSQPAGHTRASPDARDDSPEADHSDHFSEPARKKRKQGRSKTIGSSSHVSAEAGPFKALSHDAEPSSSRPGRVSTVPLKDSDSRQGHRNIASSSKLSSADTSKRIPTLGVGLRQEGDKRYRNRKLLRDLREHLYRWLGTDEFRKLRSTYKVAEWVPNPHLTDEEKQILASLPPGAVAQPPITTHIFHVDFTSRDFYRTNQSLIDAIVTEGSKKVEAKPEAYAIVPGTIDRDHLEDVAKDLMDSARSGFRMSLRTGLQAEKEDKEKHEKYRGVERAKTKCRNREIGAGRLRHAIPKQLLVPGAYSDDAASDEDLHGLTKSEWKRQRLRKLRIAKGWEAVTPRWRNKHLTRAYHKADIVSKSKQMARWRRDDPVDLPIPIKLYGKLLPRQLFDDQWLREHRKELEDEPYCIRINENDIDGWDEGHHPLGEDTSDEMEWSDAKESSRGRFGGAGVMGERGRGEMTESPVPVVGSKVGEAEGKAVVKEASDPPVETSSTILTATEENDAVKTSEAPAAAASEGSGTSSVSSDSRSGALDAGDTGGSDTDSDSSLVPADDEEKFEVTDKVEPPSAPATEGDTAGKSGESTEEVA
uniref:Uncharacterized protein n=2 Tax=Kalmanozyma brasiliensis (strain GHG001) TaxID=1365824 RepID=V5EG95_KALBG